MVGHALSIREIEGLLGPASCILDDLLRARPLGSPAHLELCLDVLVHAAGADGGMILDSGGYQFARIGIAEDLASAFVGAWRSGMPRALEQARLLHGSGVVTYTTVSLPVWAGATLVLANHEHPVRPIDTDALLALLPGIAYSLSVGHELELVS